MDPLRPLARDDDDDDAEEEEEDEDEKKDLFVEYLFRSV